MARDLWLSPYLRDPFFGSDSRRHNQRSPWNHLALLDDRVFDMGSQLTAMQRELDSAMRHFGLPNFNERGFDFLSPSVESHTDGEGKTCGKYTVNVPLGNGINPEDLKISLKDHVMTVEAKKEQKSQDGNSRVYQEFTRKFTLPSSIDMKEVKSVLTPEGYLKIEAPLPQQALPEPPKPKEIPIAVE